MKSPAFLIALLAACPGTSDDATAEASAPTTPTTSDTSGTTETNDDTTTGGAACDDPSVECDRQVAAAADFCDGVAQLVASVKIPEPYAGIVADSCAAGEPRCDVCFAVANYCAQVGEGCYPSLGGVCACIGEAFGVP